MRKTSDIGLLAVALALGSCLLAGCGPSGPDASQVERRFRQDFFCASGCPVADATVRKNGDSMFTIDFTYRQCPLCHSGINYADSPCVGHSLQVRSGRVTADVDGKGKLHFRLANGAEFDSWGVK